MSAQISVLQMKVANDSSAELPWLVSLTAFLYHFVPWPVPCESCCKYNRPGTRKEDEKSWHPHLQI